MRSITIDFTKSPVEISSMILGHKGEKNATQLVITPPAEMSSENSGIVSYSVAFQIGAIRKKHSALYEKAETITVPLELAVTQVSVLSLQLEGYDGKENLIMKSERIDNLLFDASVEGEEYNGAEESNLGAQVAANTAKLTDFSTDENGNLLYKGNPVSSERPTAEFEFEGDMELFITPDAPNGNDFIVGDFGIEANIPVGAEIKAIEFMLDETVGWFDIREMNTIDGVPYILNMYRTFDGANIYNEGYTFYAIVSFIEAVNFIYNAVQSYQNGHIKITYYTDGGESDA